MSIVGEGGIGKSSSLATLALGWSKDEHPVMQHFQWVFFIVLRQVNTDKSLERIILDQHAGLEGEGILPTDIKSVLKKEQEILILLDGLDEYHFATNKDIDSLIKSNRRNCLILMSSRPGDFLHPLKEKSHEVVTMTGFDDDSIRMCARQYLGSNEKCEQFLKLAEVSGLYTRNHGKASSLFRVPIILLMTCMLFEENHSFPSSRSEIIHSIIMMSISRTTLKTMGKTASEVKNLKELLVKLGGLAWTALKKQQMFLSKVRLITWLCLDNIQLNIFHVAF